MASVSFSLEIDDTSPTITYVPLPYNLSTTNTSAGWIPGYSDSEFSPIPGESGTGTSFHKTSLFGATLSLTWSGTAVELYGSYMNASYVVSLDDGPLENNTVTLASTGQMLLASFNGLQNSEHTVTLIARPQPIPSSYIAFDRAVVTATVDLINGSVLTQTVNDTVSFQGQWNYSCDPLLGCFHESHKAGDSAHLNFTGTAVTVIGLRNSMSGYYNVSLDGQEVVFDAQSAWEENAMLFFKTGLNPAISHELIVTNADGELLAISAINVTTISGVAIISSKTGLSNGAIAGIVIGVVFGLLLIGALIYFLWRRRKKRIQLTFIEPSIHKGHEGAQVVDIRSDAVDDSKWSRRRTADSRFSLNFAPNPDLSRFQEHQKPTPSNLPRSPTVSSPSIRNHLLRDASLGSLLHHTEPADPRSYLSVNIRSPFQVDFEHVPHVPLSPRRSISKPMGPREQPKQEVKEPKEPKEPKEEPQPIPQINVTREKTEKDQINTLSFLEMDSSSSAVSSIPQADPHLSQPRLSYTSSTLSQDAKRNSEQSRSSTGPLSFAVVIQQSNTRIDRQAETHPYSDPHLDIPSPADGVSPTDSVPMTVSEVHFREMNSDQEDFKRTSGSHSAGHPPLPSSASPSRQTFTSPTIVQKLFGLQQAKALEERRRFSGHQRSFSSPALLPRLAPNR